MTIETAAARPAPVTPPTRTRVLVRRLATGILLGLLALGIAACGSDSASGGGSGAPKPDKNNPNYEKLMTGRAVYTENCARCHGGSGEGISAPKLADGGAEKRFPKEADEITWVHNGGNGMPSFSGTLTDEEIAAVVAYTRDVL